MSAEEALEAIRVVLSGRYITEADISTVLAIFDAYDKPKEVVPR